MNKNVVKISVRNLVEFVMVKGDLDLRFTGNNRAVEGTRLHKKIQSEAGENYSSEVHLSHTFHMEKLILEVSGRADGIIEEQDEIIIDEIKTTTLELDEIDEDYNPIHWAQAKGYAYIYCMDKGLESIKVQLTYCNVESEEVKHIIKTFQFNELEDYIYNIINSYIEWAGKVNDWISLRNSSIQVLQFPFPDFREGQRKLAVSVYTTLKEEKKLFATAPTGIGKTMGTIFPTIKYIPEGKIEKIFYLTAKTITRTIAENALNLLRKNGLKLKSTTLTAKDKICFKPGSACNPDECEFAKGHFDRLRGAIEDIFTNEDDFNRDIVLKYAEKHHICPFEFSLDLSTWSDCVICDYNYAFDPRVYLRRFFEVKSNNVLLVDEAHNLVDRSREMFSAEIFKKPMLELKKVVKDDYPKLSKLLGKMNSFMIKCRKLCEEKGGIYIEEEEPKEFYSILYRFKAEMEKVAAENKKKEYMDDLLELYFSVLGVLRTAEFYDERFLTYYEKIKTDVKMKLFCLDPSHLLNEAMKKVKTSILFSATLTPIEYFMKILGGEEDSYRLILESPFKQENLCLLLNDNISTKYREREFTLGTLCNEINTITSAAKGNYIVFFPSYKYMSDAVDKFNEIPGGNNSKEILVQEPSMSEEEREEFLNKFDSDNKNTLIAFAVMGGIFGEGIDLTGDRLKGAIIVGVGLPQICFERDIIKDYFNNQGKSGFNYAYIYPGMNKVMQAVGRVIRTESDRGIVLLVDKRFSNSTYRNLFPSEWSHIKRTDSKLPNKLKDFWNEGN